MSATTVTIDPVAVITQLAENQLTEAIVTAAKATKKHRASKKPDAEENEPSIVDEILANVASGKYAVEAAANLTRIFGREFDPIAEQIVTMASQLPEDATVEVAVPTEVKKEKKPRAKKEKKTEALAEVVAEVPKEKKPRAKKEKKTEVAVEAPVEPTTEVVAKKEKKPRAKKAPVDTDDNDSVAAVAEPKKTKKVRAPTPVLPDDDENHLTLVAPQTSTLVDEQADFENHMEIEDPELEGFAAEWGEELVEEELSDIDDDE